MAADRWDQNIEFLFSCLCCCFRWSAYPLTNTKSPSSSSSPSPLSASPRCRTSWSPPARSPPWPAPSLTWGLRPGGDKNNADDYGGNKGWYYNVDFRNGWQRGLILQCWSQTWWRAVQVPRRRQQRLRPQLRAGQHWGTSQLCLQSEYKYSVHHGILVSQKNVDI